VTYQIPGAVQRFVDVNGVTLSVYEAGPADGPGVVLAHGFPELAYSWRHQMEPLAEAGFHVHAQHRQFVLPIALHKRVNSEKWTRSVEGLFERTGVMRLFGSPVTVAAERDRRTTP